MPDSTPLISLKRSMKEAMSADVPEPRSDYFPVSLYLGTDEVAKLGLEHAQVGDDMVLRASVKVASVSMHDRGNGDASYSVTLDLVAAAVYPDEATEEKEPVEVRAARKLYK